MLLKDTEFLKKGAIVEEECTDGTQPYVLLNQESYEKFYDGSTFKYSQREVVENQPDWFVEVTELNVPMKMVKAVQDFIKSFKVVKKNKVGRPKSKVRRSK